MVLTCGPNLRFLDYERRAKSLHVFIWKNRFLFYKISTVHLLLLVGFLSLIVVGMHFSVLCVITIFFHFWATFAWYLWYFLDKHFTITTFYFEVSTFLGLKNFFLPQKYQNNRWLLYNFTFHIHT